MSTATLSQSPASSGVRAGLPFMLAALAVAGLSAFLAGWLPLGFSIVTVFLFAGPHNWLEARYFLTRLPARWGRLRAFFVTAFAGLFLLTGAFAAIPWLVSSEPWDPESAALVQASWNSALLATRRYARPAGNRHPDAADHAARRRGVDPARQQPSARGHAHVSGNAALRCVGAGDPAGGIAAGAAMAAQ